MAGPANDPASQSAIERFRDIYNSPSASANTGYFKVPNKTPPPPPPQFEPPKPQKISDSLYRSQQRFDSGLTSSRPLNDNPGFRSPSPMPTVDRLNIPTMGQGFGSSVRGQGIVGVAGIGADIVARSFPGLFRYGPTYLDPRNPDSFFSGKPLPPQFTKSGVPIQDAINRQNRNALKDFGLPDWLNPFKDTSKNGDRIPEPSGRPNAESKRHFPNATIIKIWSTNGSRYTEPWVLDYSITEVPKRGVGADATARYGNGTYLRAGNDDYIFSFTQIRRVYNDYVIEKGTFNCEPWTLENLGPAPVDFPNPNAPENLVPETDKPFFPPHIPDWHGYDTASPPTVLDPNDFKPPAQRKPLSPMFPPELAPVPKPLDPLQKPEPPIVPGIQPTKPTEDEEARKVPPFPFNPFPEPTNPVQNPPTFEPGPTNPNQRLNDRGIFPARKADITSSASGSPLSPDVAIGGDPVRLKPAPTITKPKTPFETEEERKRKEAEKKLTDPFPLPLIPPVFPRPVSPTGTIDPNTADDITKSKEPPKPPVGTKPKCQDSCMAGLESGQASILDKLNSGVNVADTGLLGVINNKLGDQVPGGISGFLGKFKEGFDKLSDWLHLDRLLNILTFTMTVQNAYFLCDSLKVVTLQMVSDALSVIGIKDKEGEALNINKIIDDDVEGLLKKILGEEQLVGFKKEWKALNRIFQAGSNIISAVQSMAWSILNALDIIGSTNAQIGNALKKYKVLGERAFAWMNPAPNFHNKFFTATFNALNIVSNIDFVAQSIISARQGLDQIEQQSTEFKTDYSDLTNPKPNEHKPTATAETKAKAESVGTVASEADINNLH